MGKFDRLLISQRVGSMAYASQNWTGDFGHSLRVVVAERLELSLCHERRGPCHPGFRQALLSLQTPLVPRLGWLVAIGANVGLRERGTFGYLGVSYRRRGISLLLGIFCRFSAILVWFLHLCAAKSGAFVSYGLDDFMTIGLFYLMLSPLPDQLSLDQEAAKIAAEESMGPCVFFDASYNFTCP